MTFQKGKPAWNSGKKGVQQSWNTGQKVGRSSKWDEQFPLEAILVENSTYARHHLKKRILDNELIKYTCALCPCGPFWNGKPMVLILDHINGVNNDNRIENLRFVCSNCDSQLDTYKARNRRKKGPLSELA